MPGNEFQRADEARWAGDVGQEGWGVAEFPTMTVSPGYL